MGITSPNYSAVAKRQLGQRYQVSARDGQFYTDILKEMKAKVNRKGILIGEMVDRNDLIVLNQRRKMAFS